MAKYDPLAVRLSAAPRPIELTFDEIDQLVGGLPAPAVTWRPWWANDATHVQARAWLGAGRSVESVDIARRRVVFR
jgi:hypothetical protein